LRASIEADLAAGDRPFVVVGTAGSVGTGAVDPLPELRDICDAFGLWLHVDGAYGGVAAAAPEAVPEDLLGLRLGDSVAVDPHKWLYTPMEAGCTLVRDPSALVGAFAYRPDYYNFRDEATNYFEHGIQNSRGFRALKVWLQLRQVGRKGYARMIAEDIELARRFHALAHAHPELEAVTQGLSITTYRYVPTDLCPRTAEPAVAAYLDELNQAVQNRMERGGRAFVSNAVVGERYLLRMCVVNFRTRMEDVRELADLSVELGRELDPGLRPPALR
jgi:glutamate/tyrosine decarboxylase-like PLP-dependent enzyme